MSLPSLRASRPVSLWTRIVALISLLLIAGTLITGSLSLFLLNRTLIQSVDTNLRSGIGNMIDRAQGGYVVDEDDTRGGSIPVEYAVEIRDESGQVIDQDVVLYRDEDVIIDFPHLSEDQIRELDGQPFTVMDSAESRWRVAARVNTERAAAPCTSRCRCGTWTAPCTRWR